MSLNQPIQRSAALTTRQEETDAPNGIPRHLRNGQVAYLEAKQPNYSRVEQLLNSSAESNHWANGGPVSRLLEKYVADITGLNPDRAVVVCSSGTAALNALAGLHATKAGRPLRWAVSGFSFFTSFIGPFAGSLVVDCDEQGMFDLEALADHPTHSYDGICVTNLFGLHPDLRRYEDFCRERHKILIVDNAQGFFLVDRSRPDGPDEMISFHHTKPWGFGEGGCVIVSKQDEAIVRSLINFGTALPASAAPVAFNGKMSDVAAAYILDRLEHISNWLPKYKAQRRRITEMVHARKNLALLSPNPSRYPGTGNIPVLAARPFRIDQLESDFFVMRKYYPPPRQPGLVIARSLFARIVNIPCHLQMAGVLSEALNQALDRLSGAHWSSRGIPKNGNSVAIS